MSPQEKGSNPERATTQVASPRGREEQHLRDLAPTIGCAETPTVQPPT